MWHRKLSGIGVATFLLSIASASQVGAAGIVNGSFETGDFTGWTVVLHSANAPGGGSVDVGAQVLTGNDIFRDGSVQPGVVPPSGNFFALLSSMPSESQDEPPDCPTTQSVIRVPPDNVDSDAFSERDVTVLSQQFVVDHTPASLVFLWSFLRGEGGVDALHDDFQVTLRQVDPPGPTFRVLGVTAGSQTNPIPYAGTFPFIDPSQFDGHTYEVLTDPPGGPTDCHYSAYGRTDFRRTVFPIRAPGVWEVSFFVGDDGGDARMDSGVLLDRVELTFGQPAPALSSAGTVAVILMLVAVGIFGLAAQGMRASSRRKSLFLGAVLLLGAAILLAGSQPATGALPAAADSPFAHTTDQSGSNEVLAVRRTPRPPTPPPTRPPRNTQTPIVS